MLFCRNGLCRDQESINEYSKNILKIRYYTTSVSWRPAQKSACKYEFCASICVKPMHSKSYIKNM